MSPLYAGAIVTFLALPFLWAIWHHLALEDARSLRRHGVVIVKPSAVEVNAEIVGFYMGREIHGSLTFKGLVYRFDHVIPARDCERLGPGELYLDPGLVYVAV